VLRIRPPETTLFEQLLAYLRGKPDPTKPPSGSMVGREGVAAAALVLRWGSYLSVLLDRDKPVWALAQWIDLYREDPGGQLYTQLVNRAVAYLPMPKKTSKVKWESLVALAHPETATQVIDAANAGRLTRARTAAKLHPSRLLANACVNVAWRNGPVEDIHAGQFRGYPLGRRRVTPTEERKLMAFTCERLALAMTVCFNLCLERTSRLWADQVLPFGLAHILLITPSNWTFTETSREVYLATRDHSRGLDS
jgi:hypothetical protein